MHLPYVSVAQVLDCQHVIGVLNDSHHPLNVGIKMLVIALHNNQLIYKI